MDTTKVGNDAVKILMFLKDSDLKPDEKIAALDSAANIIRATLAAESLRLMWSSILSGKR